jgi:hypothetical protein
MKKIIIFILFVFISIDSSFACKIQMLGKDIPSDFKINCYQQVWNLNPDILWVDLWNDQKCIWRNTFKINSPKKIDTFISWNEIIPHKIYKELWNKIDYEIDMKWNINYLKDNNYKTYFTLDTDESKEINISFKEIIKAWTSEWFLEFESENYLSEYYISIDWEKYSKVDISGNWYYLSLWDFDFKYIKISFVPKNKNIILREKIKIVELNIKSTNYQYLVLTRWDIKAYSNNICNNNFPNLSNDTSDYYINNETRELNLELFDNPEYNTFINNDTDKDWIEDYIDNCKSIYNPFQKDKDWNWIWDMCSDDDNDGIIWEKDNCINIYNPDQKDINLNLVWDICEFDKDNDWIFDQLDNCINKANPDQKDTDNDWIWDICDNSIYYNPSQKDENQNGIWDITEQKEKQLKQNDTDSDGIIDYKDNCKEIANPKQEDSDKDWIWDLCDNSPYYNPDQLDENKNWIWDISEDSDNDWIEWIEDNCINIANTDQKDTDNDWIWDLCEDDDSDNILAQNDNCPFVYNPEQIDIDKDWIWDKCDETDNRYIESNSTFFIWLLVFIVIIFGWWIFLMIRKLK